MSPTTLRLPAQLGPLLRSARLAKGLTQAEVASRLGISTPAVSKLEANAAKAAFERVHRLCQILGLDIQIDAKPAASAGSDPATW